VTTFVAVADPAVMGALAVLTRMSGTGSAEAGAAQTQRSAAADRAATEPLLTDRRDTVLRPILVPEPSLLI
jgi:hypothetical protein